MFTVYDSDQLIKNEELPPPPIRRQIKQLRQDVKQTYKSHIDKLKINVFGA